MHITMSTKLVKWERQGECRAVCQDLLVQLHIPDPDTSPGDPSWCPNPKSVPSIRFFPGLNVPACSISSPWRCRDHTGISSWLWDEHSSHHCWRGQHGDSTASTPTGTGEQAGPGTLPSWGITPKALNRHKHLPPAHQAQLSSSGRTLPQHNNTRWTFHPSLLCHQPAIPEFATEKYLIKSWITSLLI